MVSIAKGIVHGTHDFLPNRHKRIMVTNGRKRYRISATESGSLVYKFWAIKSEIDGVEETIDSSNEILAGLFAVSGTKKSE